MRPRTLQAAFFIALLVLTTLAFVGLILDFMMPVFWAVVLAIIFRPMQRRWLKTVKGRQALASVLSLLSIIVIVILPLFLVGLAVTRESVALYERIASGELDLQEPLRYFERTLPLLTEQLNEFGVEVEKIRESVAGAAVTGSRFVASRALAFGQDALRFTVLLFLMLYILFFFLRDGPRLIDALVRALPLGDARERRLFAKFAEVTRATIKGTLVVGLVQGTIGGLLFWMLGLPAPVFWGVIMTLLSFLPAIGAALVWLPAALILMATGHVGKGLILLVAGTLIIGLVDNLLRPLLVGRDTQMPDFLILLSTLGGLAVFGLSGFVIGPIIAAFFLVVWEMFVEDYGAQDDVAMVEEPLVQAEAAAEAAAAGPRESR